MSVPCTPPLVLQHTATHCNTLQHAAATGMDTLSELVLPATASSEVAVAVANLILTCVFFDGHVPSPARVT